MKKIIIIISIMLVVILATFFIFNNKNMTIEKFIEQNVFENLDNYNSDYYEDYLKYLKNNPDIDKEIIILFINYCYENQIKYMDINNYFINLYKKDNFVIDNLDRYIAYLKENKTSYDNVIEIVNKDLDKFILDNGIDEDFILNLVNEKYYISDNWDRYINYYKDNKDLNSQEIVTNVNSKLDYVFYNDYQMTDTSKDYLMIVNKYYKLDSTYVPKDMVMIEPDYGYAYEIRKDVYEAFKEMYKAAKKDNISLFIVSPYRSYNKQRNIYNSYVQSDGVNKADTYSARPGFSEHQTGLAMDLAPNVYMDLDTFVDSPSYSWMIDNAYKFGFILRYPKDKEYITGYMYEPWHYRYVGIEAATIIKNENLTFEEYYEYYVK